MITEIEVEGIGTMRQLNQWQIMRLQRATRENAVDTQMAMGLGMSLTQFRNHLSPEEREQCRQAWCKLMSPEGAGLSPIRQKPRVPAKGEHVHPDRQVFIGRQLIEVRAKLPRGHFRRWVEEKSGLSWTQAQRFLKAAQKTEGDGHGCQPDRDAA